MKRLSIIKLVVFYFIIGIIYNLFRDKFNCNPSTQAVIFSCFYYIGEALFKAGLLYLLLKKASNSNDIIAIYSGIFYSLSVGVVYCFLWIKPGSFMAWCNSNIGGTVVALILWTLSFIVAYLTRKR